MSSSPRPPGPEEQPSVARIYDYFLGGFHNFAVDRAAAAQLVAMEPDFPLFLRANRGFLRRAVSFLVQDGVRQLLDLGSGIPTVGNVHEIAQAQAPETRVVYVDIDPIATAMGKEVLADNPLATVVQADALDPQKVLRLPEVQRLLDTTQPIAVLLVAFVHFIAEDQRAADLVGQLREVMAPGSYLALTHATQSFRPEMSRLAEEYTRAASPITLRTREQIAALLEGFDLVPPGLVPTPAWRPESPEDLFVDQPERAHAFAAVGRKR
jgi:S-adenosyl methyltransferase